jgi:hypothetical protein
VLSALAVLAAVMATGPALEMGINDDWSYAYSALKRAQTGRLTYSGWESAFLGFQALWGAWTIQLFGFSFTVLRLSVLPFAMGCAIVTFLLSRRCGLTQAMALLGTLSFTLSPLFIPMATSFMTDVPALFFTLLSLLAFTAAIRSKVDSRTIAWLATATIAGIAGGTIRQIVWLAPLVLIPACMLYSAQAGPIKRPVLACAGSLWILALLTWLGCDWWHRQQADTMPVEIVENLQRAFFNPISSLRNGVSICQAAVMFILPAALVDVVACVQGLRKRQRGLLLLATLLLLFGFRYALGVGPLMGNIVTQTGILDSGTDALGVKPQTLPRLLRGGAQVLVCLSFACLILRVRPGLSHIRDTFVRGRWREYPAVMILLPYSVVYVAVLVFLADGIIDRYVLPLTAVFAIGILQCGPVRVSTQTLVAAYAVLAVFAGYGIATTHDYLAAGRARVRAAVSVQAAGVPRTNISAGLEYDGWTQLEQTGHLEKKQNRGYRLPVMDTGRKPENYWFWDATPDVRPRYFVAYSPQVGLSMPPFARVPYAAWLPPFHREILVQTQSTAGGVAE